MHVAVDNMERLERRLRDALDRRSVTATNLNAHSSRAHTIFQLHFTATAMRQGRPEETCSTLTFVDLAGNERLKKSRAKGQQACEPCAADEITRQIHVTSLCRRTCDYAVLLHNCVAAGATGCFEACRAVATVPCRVEAAQINLSLLMLGNVVAKLAEGRPRSWLPFRNSKLTRILQSTLGGASRAVVIASMHPGVEHAEETATTLRFASRAMKVQNSVGAAARRTRGPHADELHRDVDALMGPIQARKIAQLHSQQALCLAQVRCGPSPSSAAYPVAAPVSFRHHKRHLH